MINLINNLNKLDNAFNITPILYTNSSLEYNGISYIEEYKKDWFNRHTKLKPEERERQCYI